MKISAVYKIVNTVTNECYIGSSKNFMQRLACHKCPSSWKQQPNNKLYQDFQKYGLDKFDFQILISIMPECLRAVEQDCIELMKPAYNNRNANGLDVERRKECLRRYRQTDKGKEYNRKQARKDMKKYNNQLCSYNGETLTLNALSSRFRKTGLEHPVLEAKKYLISEQHN